MKATTAILLAGLLVGSFACGSDSEPEDCPTPGGDGQYVGYDYCSGAAYPDFTHPTSRWDGTYPDNCEGTSGEDAWACAEQLTWHTLQFDHAGRESAYGVLRELVFRVDDEKSLDELRMARLYLRVAQLGVAVIAEDGGDVPPQPIQLMLERAHELQPDDLMIEGWLYTLLVNGALVLQQDLDAYLDRLWDMYDEDPNVTAPIFMALFSGFPLDTGLPQVAIEMADGLDLSNCEGYCDWTFLRAPFGLAGQHFTAAEVYARVGDANGAIRELELARLDPLYDEWQLKEATEEALADIDGFLAPFQARGDDEDVTDLMIGASEQACMVCHAPRPSGSPGSLRVPFERGPAPAGAGGFHRF